jgi:hypothetical protein
MEQLEAAGAQLLGVEGHGREWRFEHACEVHVVEADHGQVGGDAQPALAGGEVQTGGDEVVVAEHRCGPLGEQRAGGVVRVVDADRGHGARLSVGFQARLGQNAPAGRLAQVEGWRVEAGREVSDAPVPEPEQVAERGRRPALCVEAHRRAPRRLPLDQHDVLVGPERLRRADLE